MGSRGLALAAAALASVGVSAFVAGEPDHASRAPVGTIRGRVEIRAPLAQPAPRPGVAALGTDRTSRPDERHTAVVYLETAPQAAFEGGGATSERMIQADQTFVPHVLAIRVGTVVDFPNNDSIYHNVFSLSKTRRFDLGRYAKGQSKSVRFDEPGIVRVFCDIHSHMNAYIVVFAHGFFSATDGTGRYRIDRVPPGTYTLAAWYEGAVRETRSVTVPDDGAVPDVDFVVR